MSQTSSAGSRWSRLRARRAKAIIGGATLVVARRAGPLRGPAQRQPERAARPCDLALSRPRAGHLSADAGDPLLCRRGAAGRAALRREDGQPGAAGPRRQARPPRLRGALRRARSDHLDLPLAHAGSARRGPLLPRGPVGPHRRTRRARRRPRGHHRPRRLAGHRRRPARPRQRRADRALRPVPLQLPAARADPWRHGLRARQPLDDHRRARRDAAGRPHRRRAGPGRGGQARRRRRLRRRRLLRGRRRCPAAAGAW